MGRFLLVAAMLWLSFQAAPVSAENWMACPTTEDGTHPPCGGPYKTKVEAEEYLRQILPNFGLLTNIRIVQSIDNVTRYYYTGQTGATRTAWKYSHTPRMENDLFPTTFMSSESDAEAGALEYVKSFRDQDCPGSTYLGSWEPWSYSGLREDLSDPIFLIVIG